MAWRPGVACAGPSMGIPVESERPAGDGSGAARLHQHGARARSCLAVRRDATESAGTEDGTRRAWRRRALRSGMGRAQTVADLITTESAMTSGVADRSAGHAEAEAALADAGENGQGARRRAAHRIASHIGRGRARKVQCGEAIARVDAVALEPARASRLARGCASRGRGV